MTVRQRMHFQNWTTRQDPKSEPEYKAVCVADDGDRACLAESQTEATPDDADDWMRAHQQDTGHRYFRRTFTDFAELVPTDQLEPARVQRVTA